MPNRKSVVCKGQLKTKEVKAMKYETPELTALTPAIDAIQKGSKLHARYRDVPGLNEPISGYADWE